MTDQDAGKAGEQGISKVKLALGAASLFLFIIGVKKTFQMDNSEDGKEAPARERRRKETSGKKKKRPRR